MGLPVLIIGKSGSGKSASMRNFKAEEIGLINVERKPLPFRNNFRIYNSDDYGHIKKALHQAKAKTLVIDDAGYLITNAFMRGHSSTGGKGSGKSVYSLYNDLADQFWQLIEFCKDGSMVADDKIVYIIMHEDKDDMGDVKPKTIGKLLDEKVCLEGMFTIVLRSFFKDGKYIFKTQTNGFDVCKSPIGMFDEVEIDNDLKFVDDTIRDYYNMQ